MSKYKVEVGGFVSVYRQRTLIIHAENEEEASKKAIEKFIDFQQEKVGNMCDEGQVNSIEEM
jgi:hypothetical protein